MNNPTTIINDLSVHLHGGKKKTTTETTTFNLLHLMFHCSCHCLSLLLLLLLVTRSTCQGHSHSATPPLHDWKALGLWVICSCPSTLSDVDIAHTTWSDCRSHPRLLQTLERQSQFYASLGFQIPFDVYRVIPTAPDASQVTRTHLDVASTSHYLSQEIQNHFYVRWQT